MAERDTDTRHGDETMDPNTAYRMMSEHLKDGDYSEAYDMAYGLRQWLRKGGFLPTGHADREALIRECNAILFEATPHVEV